MYTKIDYNRTVQFTGRNGTFKQKGLSVFSDSTPNEQSVILLVPITSKQMDANCGIEIPDEQVDDLIKALLSRKQDGGEDLCKEILSNKGILTDGLWCVEDVLHEAKKMDIELTDDEWYYMGNILLDFTGL